MIKRSLAHSYETIAADFDRTRQSVTTELQAAADYIKAGDRVLDLGCGNGRLLKAVVAVNFDYLGIDDNGQLLDQARRAFPRRGFSLSDILTFDYGQNQWDVVVAVASFHHLLTPQERLQVLRSIHQSLRPSGRLLLTNWRLWQWRYLPGFFRCWTKKLAWNDAFITWNHAYPRYYHAFTQRELSRLLRQAGFPHSQTRIIRHNYLTVAVKQ